MRSLRLCTFVLYSYWNSYLPSKSFFFFFVKFYCSEAPIRENNATLDSPQINTGGEWWIQGRKRLFGWRQCSKSVVKLRCWSEDREYELLALPMWVEGRLSFFPFPLLLFGLWLLNNAGDSLRNYPKCRWTAVRVEVLLCFPVHHLSDFHLFHCISVWIIVSCLSWVS